MSVLRSVLRVLRWALPVLLPAAAAAQTPAPIGLLEAVRLTVTAHPDVQVRQEDVAIARSDLQEARAQFDTRLTTGFRLQRTHEPQFLQLGLISDGLFFTSLGTVSSYSVGVEKQLRSGLLVRPTIQMDRTAQTIAGSGPAGEDIRLLVPGQNRTNLSVQVTQPLVRGRSREAVLAFERAAETGIDVSASLLRHTVASAVLRTALSYWSYVSAVRREAIVRAAETRAETMVEETEALIAADAQPASDLKLVEATLANRRATRLGVEQGTLAARRDLVLAAGYGAGALAGLGDPADPFPPLPVPGTLDDAVLDALVAEGLARRADLAAAREREVQLGTLSLAARDGVRPDVSLLVDANYVGLREGRAFLDYVSPLQRLDGFGVSAAFVYRAPIGNQAAIAQLARSDAAVRQSRTNSADLARTIEANVAVAWHEVQLGVARVEEARRGSALYRSAVEDERVKVQLGLATVLDLIVTEDRLVQSLLDEVSAEAAYAAAVARLRFETGTLVGRGATGADITFDRLTTLPQPVGP